MKIYSKKGDVFQLMFVLIICFVVAIVGLITLSLTLGVTHFWTTSGLLNNTALGTQSNAIIQASAPNTVDYMVFFLFLGSTIGLTISAVRTNFSPTIIFMFLLLLIITIFVASGIVNIYSGFANAPGLQEAGGDLILTGWLFSKYTPLIMAVMGGLIMLIMFSRSGGDIIT